MKKTSFIWSALLMLVILLFTLDALFTWVFKKDSYHKLIYLQQVKNKTYDGLFLSNSRGIGINADTIQKMTNKKIYNAWIDGSNIMHQYLALSQWFENGNTTKYVILNLDPWALSQRLDNTMRVWGFLPFIDNDTTYFHLKSHFPDRAWVWRYFPFWRYAEFNSRLGFTSALNSMLKIAKPNYHAETGDLINISKKTIKNFDFGKTDTVKLRKDAIQFVDLISSLCNKNKIQLIVYTAPVYKGYKKTMIGMQGLMDSVLNPFFKQRAIKYIDFSDHSLSISPQYFYDGRHLNEQGRSLFTQLMTDSIIRTLP